MDVDQFFKAAFRVSIRAIACASSIIPKLFRDFSGMNFIMATIIGSASSMEIGALLEACSGVSYDKVSGVLRAREDGNWFLAGEDGFGLVRAEAGKEAVWEKG